jgi:predicted RNase H-like nuclease (RuvC/YqgF family)
MPRLTREFLKRSRAAKKGWETRRRNNPQKWGKRSVAENREVKKLKRQLEKMKKQVEQLKKKRRIPKRFKKISIAKDYAKAIQQVLDFRIHPDHIYRDLARIFKKTPREVYSTLMGSPEVA